MEEIKKKLKDELLNLYSEGTDLFLDELERKGAEIPERKKDEKRKKTNLEMDY